MLDTQMVNKTGPSIEACGTPYLAVIKDERFVRIVVCNLDN